MLVLKTTANCGPGVVVVVGGGGRGGIAVVDGGAAGSSLCGVAHTAE